MKNKKTTPLPEAQPLEGVKTAEEIEQYFYNHSDCYADTDNGLPITAMTLEAVKRLMINAQFATDAGGGG